MLFDISEIISTTGKTVHLDAAFDMATFDYEGQTCAFIEKNPVDLKIANIGESKVVISGTVDVTLELCCDRCLSPVPTPLSFDFETKIDFKAVAAGELEDLDDISFIEDSSLDIDKFVYNEILIHLPMKVLCKEDCKGLCLRCGKNLNEGECGCDRASLDPRMAAISDIFNNYKGV